MLTILLNLGVHELETTKDKTKSKGKHCEHHGPTGAENGQDQNVERWWNHNPGLRLLTKF